MSNNITVIGRLGRDGELKNAGGTALFEFALADTQGFGDKKTTNWFKCNLWGKQAEGGVTQYLIKGAQVAVYGEVTLREYEKDGVKRISPEIRVNRVELIGGKSENQAPAQQRHEPAQQAAQQKPARDDNDFESDVPF